MTLEDEPPGWKVSNMILEKSRGHLLTAPEKMRQLVQNGNEAQLWLCLVVKAKSVNYKLALTKSIVND